MKKRISLALVLTLSISSLAFVSCKKESTTTDYDKVYPDRQVNTYSFDIIGGGDVMPVGLYFGPYTPNGSTNDNVMPNFTDEYYIKTAFSSDEQYYNFIEDFKLKSLYASDVILTAESDILTLTTCHKYDVSNGRLVVHAVKVGTGILAS